MKIFFLLLWSIGVHAQIQSLDVTNSGIGNNGSVRFFNPAIQGGGNAGLNYSDIRGNCFWNTEWLPAKIVTKKGQVFRLKNVKLNFYSEEMHYLNDKEQELVAASSLLRSVRFTESNDTSKTVALFESHLLKDGEFLLQVLTGGKTQFLKRVISNIHKGAYDPMLGKADIRFVTITDYYVNHEGTITRLKDLDKESLSTIIRISSDMQSWLSSKKNKLKKESDFIAFFEYYNGKN